MSLYVSPNYWGENRSLRDMCFGDVKQIPNSRDIDQAL